MLIMKKMQLLAAACLLTLTLHAQLAGTKWNTRINAGELINTILDFGKDTCTLYTVADSTLIETMTYSVKDSIVTLSKVDGQSDCDAGTPATYKFKVTDNKLSLIMVSDDCSDRSSAFDNTKWVPWFVPTGIKLDDAVLQQYIGTYQLDAAHPIMVTLEGHILYVEGPNNNLPKSPLTPVSGSRFFIRIAGVYWDFVKDAQGKVIKGISHEQQDYELEKVK